MHVFSNSAMSVDGKLATWQRDHVSLGSEADRRFMSTLRARADAVLVGGGTFRNWALPLVERPDDPSSRRQPLLNVVLTRSGRGPRQGRFFQDARTRPVFLGGARSDLEGFPSGVEVHRAPGEPTVDWAVGVLREQYGVHSLLVEAGGALIFQFMAAGWLHEIYVTVTPWFLGGGEAPTLADGEGFPAPEARRLELVSTRQVGGELFLRYRVLEERGLDRSPSGD